MPHEAETTTFGRASSIRLASSCARETAEHDRVNRADAGAGQHRDHGLRHHRHVDDDAVARLHALSREYAGEPRHLVSQFAVGEARRGSCDGRVVDESQLVAAAALDMPVERVVTGVQAPAGEPAVERRLRVVEDPLPRLVPVDRRRSLRPETVRILERTTVDLLVAAHVRPSSSPASDSNTSKLAAATPRVNAPATTAPGQAPSRARATRRRRDPSRRRPPCGKDTLGRSAFPFDF